MTPADRRLVALAALFAPAAAGSLLSRLAVPGPEALAEAATRLAGRSRAERLAALAEGLEPLRSPEEARGLLAAALLAERPSVARALRDRIPPELRSAGRAPSPSRRRAASLLRRACVERVAAFLDR